MLVALLLLLILGLITLFVLQNTLPVTVSFLFWKFEASLAIVIFISVILGMIFVLALIFAGRFKRFINKKKV
jgi:uncharacterized integral membrane protein